MPAITDKFKERIGRIQVSEDDDRHQQRDIGAPGIGTDIVFRFRAERPAVSPRCSVAFRWPVLADRRRQTARATSLPATVSRRRRPRGEELAGASPGRSEARQISHRNFGTAFQARVDARLGERRTL